MKIEIKAIALNPFQVVQNGEHYLIKGAQGVATFSKQQFSYFDHLSHGQSLEQLIKLFLKQGWLVSFRDLFFVLDQLITQGLVKDLEVVKYWGDFKQAQSASTAKKLEQTDAKPLGAELSHWPFFRTLNQATQEVFRKNTEIINVEANRLLMKSGSTDRDLYYLIQGQLGVYRVLGHNQNASPQRSLITRLFDQSVVGEGGFFLGKARTADVITLGPSQLARIRYNQTDFESLIKSDKAEALQKRFWILNAIMGSDTLGDLPDDTIDALIFSGRFVEVKAHQKIFDEGSLGQAFYIIAQGTVIFTQNSKTIRVLQQGSIFGEVALIVSSGRRTAAAIAQSDSVLLEISVGDFYNILAKNIFLAKEIDTLAWNRFHNTSKK